MSQNRGNGPSKNGFSFYSTPHTADSYAEHVAKAKSIINSGEGWIYPETRKIVSKPVIKYPTLNIQNADLFLKRFVNATKARIARTLEYNKSSLVALSEYVANNQDDLNAYACYALLTDNITLLDNEKLQNVLIYLTDTGNEQVLLSIEFIIKLLNQSNGNQLTTLLKDKKFSNCYLNMSGILFHKVILQENITSSGSVLSYANLANTDFSTSDPKNSSLFDNVNMSGVRLFRANLDKVKFNRCTLEAADLRGCSMNNTSFTDTTFRRANLSYVDLTTVGFNHVSLSRTILIGALTKPINANDRVHLGEAELIDINIKLDVNQIKDVIVKWQKLNVPNVVTYQNVCNLIYNKALKYEPEDKKSVLLELVKLFEELKEEDVKGFDMRMFHFKNRYLDIQKKLTQIEYQLTQKPSFKK
jgi:uncharacterized protein YjbI with pentapeptide repeats